jgi:hypothetical protein
VEQTFNWAIHFWFYYVFGFSDNFNPCYDFLSKIFDETNYLLGNASGPIGDLHSNGHLNPY